MDESTKKTLFCCIGVGVLMLSIGILLGQNTPYYGQTVIPTNPEFQNCIVGLNLIDLGPGNYSYPVEIVNPYENMTIRVYSYLFSDPEGLKDYVVFSWDLKDGTKLNPFQSVNATFSLSVSEHPFENSELYVRVGCLRIGEEI